MSSSGEQARSRSTYPHLSADGQFITFLSIANNLVSNDTNQKYDVFVHDRQTGKTERVSVSSSGVQADLHSGQSLISANGRFVAFNSTATNLDGPGLKYKTSVYIHDRETGKTDLVSVSSNGIQANSSSTLGSISADGSMVLFSSLATNLYEGTPGTYHQSFIRHRFFGTTNRILDPSSSIKRSVTSPVLSGDDNHIAFIVAHEGLLYPYTVLQGDIFVTESVQSLKQLANQT